jgi:hypothetical protein
MKDFGTLATPFATVSKVQKSLSLPSPRERHTARVYIDTRVVSVSLEGDDLCQGLPRSAKVHAYSYLPTQPAFP